MNGLDLLNDRIKEWCRELHGKWPEAEMLPARSHLDQTITLIARRSKNDREICCALFAGSWSRNALVVTESQVFDTPVHYTKLRRPFLELFRASMDEGVVAILGVRDGKTHVVRHFKTVKGARAALRKVIYGKAS
jgi:hypothetical protein